MSQDTILKRVPERVRNNISNFTSLLPTVFLDLQNRFQTHPTVLEQFKSYLGFLGFPPSSFDRISRRCFHEIGTNRCLEAI